jgi:transketolase
MRGAFVRALAELANDNPHIVLLTGDLGYMAIEPFAERFPARFFNMGVAEQNMMGVATGLAEAGLMPFVYSIAPFAVLRPYEFIRNGPIAHHFPVRIVGVGGGIEYGINGPSHYGLEDVAVMRVQPGITVIAPADHEQTRTALRATWDLPGPIYYRLGKDDKTVVPGINGRFELGRAQIIREGSDLVFIVMGGVAKEVVTAAEVLSGRGVACAVVVVASLNPTPVTDLIDILARFPIALTVEVHYLTGGVGSLVAEIVAEHRLSCRVRRCGVKATLEGMSGSQAYLYRLYGLSSERLVETALQAIEQVSN